MAGLAISTASEALKEDYQPVVREQLNNINVILSQVEKNTEDTVGLEAVLNLHVSRNSGVGSRAENGTLPTAGSQGYKKTAITLKRHYGRIQISGPVIKAMASDAGAWVRAVESETKGVVTDLKRNMNRQVFGTSNGVIGQCGTTSSSTTVVVSNFTAVQMRQLENGMVVDIGTVASPTGRASARTISALDRTAKTFVVSGAAITTADTDFVFVTGSGGETTSQVELTGLQTIVAASGSLFGVDPATYDSWVSYVDVGGSVTRTPTDTVFEKAMDEANILSGQTDWLLVTSHAVARAHAATLKAQKRFNDTRELLGGYKGLVIDTPQGTSTLVVDRDNPESTAFGLATNHLVEFVASDWSWMDEDGAVLNRVANVDAYEATLYRYSELATDQRNAHFKLTFLATA